MVEKNRKRKLIRIVDFSVEFIIFIMLVLSVKFLFIFGVYQDRVERQFYENQSNIDEIVEVVKDVESIYNTYMNTVNAAITVTGDVNCELFYNYIAETDFFDATSELMAIGIHRSVEASVAEDLDARLVCIYPQTEVFQSIIGLETFDDDENIDAGKKSLMQDKVFMTPLFKLASGNEGVLLYLYNNEVEGTWLSFGLRYEEFFRKILGNIDHNFTLYGPSGVQSGSDVVFYENYVGFENKTESVKESFEFFGQPFEIVYYYEFELKVLPTILVINFSLVVCMIVWCCARLYASLRNKK